MRGCYAHLPLRRRRKDTGVLDQRRREITRNERARCSFAIEKEKDEGASIIAMKLLLVLVVAFHGGTGMILRGTSVKRRGILVVVFHGGTGMILRGTSVKRSQAPRWMVSYHSDTQHQFNCGGTLIAPRIIHTAGHCLRKQDQDGHFVVTLNDFLSDTAEKSEIKRTGSDWYLRNKKHSATDKADDYGLIFLDKPVNVCDEEDYNTLLADDYGLIFHDKPVNVCDEEDYNTLQAPIIIDSSIFPNETAVLEPASMMGCSITGWGLNEKGRYDPPLMRARPRKMYTIRGMIYVVKYDNDARACNGDSGSPLVCKIRNIPVLMGNVAGGIAIDDEAVQEEKEDWKKCDLRRDVYSYITRQMPVLEKEIRKRGMWEEFVDTQRRCAAYYMERNGNKWIH